MRCFRKANIELDHFLVEIKFNYCISSKRSNAHNKYQRFDVDRLKDEGMIKTYQSKLEERLVNFLCNEPTVEFIWESLRNAIKTTAEETIEYQTKIRNNDWYDEECKMAIKR